MKIKCFLTLCLCFFLSRTSAQNAYYDALKLASFVVTDDLEGKTTFNAGKRDSIWLLLKRHIPKDGVEDKDILEYYKKQENNPFFHHLFPNDLKSSEDFKGKDKAGFSSVVSGIGDLDVTNIADGLAKFIVKRAKEELSIAFFKKFKEDLERKDFEELRTLFPKTAQTLRLIDKDIYRFSAYLNTMREAFGADLGNSFVNIRNVFYLPVYKKYFEENCPEMGMAIYSTLYLIEGISTGKHPGQIFAGYKADSLITLCKKDGCDPTKLNAETNARASVKTLQLFSESFRSRSSNYYWVNTDSVKALVRNPMAFRIYLGLIYMHAKRQNIVFQNGLALTSILKKVADEYEQAGVTIARYREYLVALSAKCQEVGNSVKEFSSIAFKERDGKDYLRVFNASMGLIMTVVDLPELPHIEFGLAERKTMNETFGRFKYVLNLATGVYTDVQNERYAGAVIGVVSLLDTLTGMKQENLAKVLRYGSFMASVAQAKNSDEVEAAIEAIALPAGSFRIKREALRNISINSYIGPFAGLEQVSTLDNAPVFAYGLTAPIGLAFSTSSKNCGSSSFFVSVLDLGAVAAFRLQNDTIAQIPNIQLKNIFSPGLFYSYGFRKLPLSLNVGAQIGPNLRTVTSAKNDYSDNLYVRYSVSLVVDIPLLNLKTRPRE